MIYYHKLYRSSCTTPVIFLMKLEFPRQIFRKSSDIKFHDNPSSGSSVVPCGRTQGLTDLISFFYVIASIIYLFIYLFIYPKSVE